MKRRSFSVTDGRSIDTPGTLTLLRDRMAPPTTNSQSSSSSVLPTTRISSFAVGDQQSRPDRNVAHDRGNIHVNHLAGGEVRTVRAAHRHPVARAEIDAVPVFVGDRRHADLGALGVDHDRNGRIDPVHDLDDAGGALLRDVGAELIRITSIPASKSFETNSSVQRKSDMVATILVFFMRYIESNILFF